MNYYTYIINCVNPHPCGYLGDPTHECKDSMSQITRYQKKISGPMLDRIDIHIDVPAVKTNKLLLNQKSNSDTSKEIRKKVQLARDLQTKRFKNEKIVSNSELTTKLIKKYCSLDNESQEVIKLAIEKLNLSARSYNKILKIARTIADLEKAKNIKSNHIAEALQYRPKIDTI